MSFDLDKPRGALCKRSELIRWTRWKEKVIEVLVSERKLGTWRLRPNSKPLYRVADAQAILDQEIALNSSNGAKRRTESRAVKK